MPKKFSKFKISGERPNVRLSPRDRQLFSYLERYTLLRTDHLHRLMNSFEPWSLHPMQERLKRLWKAGYLHRTLIDPIEAPGSVPLTYALTDKGGRALQDVGLLIGDPKRYNENNKRRERDSSKTRHSLMVSAFVSSVEAACNQHEGLSFIGQETLLEGWQGGSLKLELEEAGKRYFAIPDAIFGIRYQAYDNRASYYYLEADRGTENLSYNPNKTTIEGKAWAYILSARKYAPSKRYPPLDLPNFRVLFLTSKSYFDRKDHLEGIIKTCTTVSKSNIFLFGRFEDNQSLNTVLKMPLVQGSDLAPLNLEQGQSKKEKAPA